MPQELRSHITAPYRTYTGRVLNERQCKEYNDIQDDINRWILAGRPVPEYLLFHSFNTLRMLAEMPSHENRR